MENIEQNTDIERLDWLEVNASRVGIKPDRVGIKPDWIWIEKNEGWIQMETNGRWIDEFTGIRERIDALIQEERQKYKDVERPAK